MSNLKWMWCVVRKELLDIARDRRTLFMALLLGPLMYPLLMLGMNFMAEKRMKTEMDRVLEVPVIGAEHAPNLVAHLATLGIQAIDAPADLDAQIAAQQVDVAIEIPASFAEDWHAGRPATVEVISDSTRRNAETPTRRVRNAITAYGQQVGALRLLARGIDPSVVQPVAVGTRDMATEEAKRGILLSVLLPYLLILSSFIGGSYLILDATAGERERQSLEPLLATPASRGAIVSGKIAAACLIGMASLVLTMLAFKVSAQMGGGSAKLLDVSFAAIGKMLLVLLPMLFVGTSLLTFLAATAKSMKEAQSHIVWLMLLPMIPSFVLMINPIKTELWQFAVPFLAQNQLLLKIIRAEPIEPAIWAVYLGASLAIAAALWMLAVWRYRQEKLAVAS
ncbi:ABC transporter permease [Luteimonas terrae]|uniref:ABC transporter permease n=1 Tax=Luteimonas terrae TaxID=1530191 RepID=A0A4R5U944_9GAMM|nr:ABC transporter permease [Luteimonas terrae]KPN16958.1 sodium ABC transporter permease [Xanthomonas sp. Mitacek01]TDK31030.1 ABC transporter permease [Luteimonas terrae]